MVDDLRSMSPAGLAQRRDLLLTEFRRIEFEFDRKRKEDKRLVRRDQLVWEPVGAIHPMQQEGHRLARLISPELGFAIHTFRVFQREIAPGGVEAAFHTHGDAVKYYLRGSGKEVIGEGEYEVRAGDLAFIPANVWHGTENTGDEPMVFIAFLQLPGTHLPVPAPWQYQMSDLEGAGTLDEFLASVSREAPASMPSATLYSRRQHFLHELGTLDAEFNRRRQQKRYVVRQEQVDWKHSTDGQSVALIAPELGFDIHALQLSLRVVPPEWEDAELSGKGETVYYVLAGTGQQTSGDKTIDISEGDLLFIPAGEPHQTKNPGREPLSMIVAEQIPGTYLQVPTTWEEPALSLESGVR